MIREDILSLGQRKKQKMCNDNKNVNVKSCLTVQSNDSFILQGPQ